MDPVLAVDRAGLGHTLALLSNILWSSLEAWGLHSLIQLCGGYCCTRPMPDHFK